MRRFLIALNFIMNCVYTPLAFIFAGFFYDTPQHVVMYILMILSPYLLFRWICSQYNKRHPEKPIVETKFEQVLNENSKIVYPWIFLFLLLVQTMIRLYVCN